MKKRVCCFIMVLSILCLPAQQVFAAPAGPASQTEEKKPHEKEHEKPVLPHEKKHEKPVPPHEKPKPPVTGEKPIPPHEKEKVENKQPQAIPTVTPTMIPEENTEISSSVVVTDKTTNTGKELVKYALQFVGNPYKYGGTSLTNGADCSGFVQSVYSHFNYSISRTSKEQAVNAGYTDVALKESELLPGDLIFYASSNGAVYHVALYIGDGKVVHAANAHAGIIVSEYTYMRPYKARRIIEA